MKSRLQLAALALLCVALTVPVSASTVYDSGPINGQIDAWTINFGFVVSDSFTLGTSTTLTGAQIGLWIIPTGTPLTLDWAIGTCPGCNDLASGTGASLTNTFLFNNIYGFDIYSSTFALNGTLAAGTYWLSLFNAADSIGNPVYWDENDGLSAAWESAYGYLDANSTCYNGNQAPGYNGYCSESFQIYGETPAVPEPSSLLLFGTGLVGAAGVLRRKLSL